MSISILCASWAQNQHLVPTHQLGGPRMVNMLAQMCHLGPGHHFCVECARRLAFRTAAAFAPTRVEKEESVCIVFIV